MLTKEELIELGFKELPHKTITGSLVYDLGRDRSLSANDVGTPNEMLWITERTDDTITDAVCLHNYDYDGYMSLPKMEMLLYWFGS
jgi:hypothetical protein